MELKLPIRVLFVSTQPLKETLRRNLALLNNDVTLVNAQPNEIDDYLGRHSYFHVICMRAEEWRKLDQTSRVRYIERVHLIVLGPDVVSVDDILGVKNIVYISKFPRSEEDSITALIQAFQYLSAGQSLTESIQHSSLLSFHGENLCWKDEDKTGAPEKGKLTTHYDPPLSRVNIGTVNVKGNYINYSLDKVTKHYREEIHPIVQWIQATPASEQPDLIIFCNVYPNNYSENSNLSFVYKLYSPLGHLGLDFREFRSADAIVSPKLFLEQVFSYLNENIDDVNPDRLKSIGYSLYDQLFPDDLKELYWNRLRNTVKSILIISDEPWIPWELILPTNPNDPESEKLFFCEKFSLARWLGGKQPPSVFHLLPLGIINAITNSSAVSREESEIRNLFVEVVNIPPSRTDVMNFLKSGGFNWIHFACHGEHKSDSPEFSSIFLEDGNDIMPIDINPETLRFGDANPFIFLNTCETGQRGYSLTGMGGWSDAFIGRAGCGGFLGSLWNAQDDSASEFSIALYKNLKDGKPIGEATRLARLSIKKDKDPTWLSYTLYANPLARNGALGGT